MRTLGTRTSHVFLTGAGLPIGLVVAWLFVAVAWVMFDSLIPMVSTATIVLLVAAALGFRRGYWGLAAGLVISCIAAVGLFLLLSLSAPID